MTRHADPLPDHTPFEPELVTAAQHMFNERIAFNKTIGVQLTSFTPTGITARIRMQPGLVGNFAHNRMHGGVTSTCLDSAGGFAAIAAVMARHRDEPIAKRLERFGKLGTIDLRVDFLRPVQGEQFNITAEVLRLGSRVAYTRMEFRAMDGLLLSTGAAAFIVS